MASPAQIAANQANGRKSRGPTSARGREVSSMNALKHGRRSKKVRRMRDDSYSFEERLRKWMTTGDARSDVEEFLMYRNVCLSFELDRAEHQRIARCETLIENSDEDEFAEIEALGKRLFFDPVGPPSLYGNHIHFGSASTSWNGKALDDNDPAVLVKLLERSEAGCCWLLDQFHDLRSILESLGFWQSHDRLKIIRLLGRQPVEANEDVRVAQVFLACHALHKDGETAFDDLLSDMSKLERERYRRALKVRWPEVYRDRPEAEWRQMLFDVVDQEIERLNPILADHQQNADAVAERTYARLSFDPSPEGEALRNYILKCTNSLHRGLATYRKYQDKGRDAGRGAGSPPQDGTGPDRSTGRRSEGVTNDGSRYGAVDTAGLGDGQGIDLSWAYDCNDATARAPQPPCSAAADTQCGCDGAAATAAVTAGVTDSVGTTGAPGAVRTDDRGLPQEIDSGCAALVTGENGDWASDRDGADLAAARSSGQAEIIHCTTNEPNLHNSASAGQDQTVLDVRTTSDVDLALDNQSDRLAGAGEREPGRAWRSGTPGAIPEHQAASCVGDPRVEVEPISEPGELAQRGALAERDFAGPMALGGSG